MSRAQNKAGPGAPGGRESKSFKEGVQSSQELEDEEG